MIIAKSLKDDRIVNLLAKGAVGVIPTDTVYGLVASAGNPDAVARLYALKNRERKPGTIVAADLDQVRSIGVSEADIKVIGHLWPNPLSVELPTTDEFDYLGQGTGHFAVRIPKPSKIRKFLQHTGPLLTTSANLPGEPPASNLAKAQSYFGDKVDFYVDGGTITNSLPSTVVKVAGGVVEVKRPGSFKLDNIKIKDKL